MTERTFFPLLYANSTVGEKTREWWQEIGRSLMAFTEVEQTVIDWAVKLDNDPSLWQSHFLADLKKLVPVLRRAVGRYEQRLLPKTWSEITAALAEVESLTDLRNEIAHMRLRFTLAPLAGQSGDDDEWIPTASHVEIRLKPPLPPTLEPRGLDWIRSATDRAYRAWRELHAAIEQAAVELGLAGAEATSSTAPDIQGE